MLTLTCLLLIGASSSVQPAVQQLDSLLAREWESTLAEDPVFATEVGDPRFNARLPDASAAAREREQRHAREMLALAKKLDRSQLGEARQLDLDLFLYDLEREVSSERFCYWCMPISQMGGAHELLPELAQLMPKRNAKDYQDFIERIVAYPVYIDQVIAAMREGLSRGITPPRITLRNVGKAIEAQIVADPAKHPALEYAFPSGTSSGAREYPELRSAAAKALAEHALPALRRLHAFFIKEYEPKARVTIGMSELPDGRAWYAQRVRNSTTTAMTPEEIHALGLSEVKRIRAEMEKIKAATRFKGSLTEFFTFLRSDPRFYFTDKEALVAAYRDIGKRIDPELVRLFGTLPRLPYGVVAVPAYSEKSQTTAYYQSGSLEAGRPGLFYANTYNLASRPKWEMEALTLHEAVPGHHLQLALAQELGALPPFRRHLSFTAFVEGWGLYAESLGGELGLYQDPYSRFGQLTYEMWRAIRLVVDTGIHAKGWTRDQAIAFFTENAGKTEHDIVVEVDRYIVWPGQALAYKIGELKLQELKREMKKTLGAKFDVRAFHDAVLGAGALPLSTLEARVRAWGQRQL